MTVDEVIARLIETGQMPLGLRLSKAAKLLDIGRSKFYLAVKKGEIKTVEICGQQRVPLDELLRLIGGQK